MKDDIMTKKKEMMMGMGQNRKGDIKVELVGVPSFMSTDASDDTDDFQS
jgi:hypothetical protein